MAAPPAQQTSPGYSQPSQPGYSYPATPGYGASPPPGQWSPPAAAPAPRPMNWDMISFLFRALGFILIAVGALVLVVAGQFSGSCYATTSTCTSVASTTISGLANAYIAGEAVIILGALLLGLGAGIKLHWVLRAPSGGSSEQFAWVLMERIFNYAVLAVSLVILTWTVWTMPILWALIRGAAH